MVKDAYYFLIPLALIGIAFGAFGFVVPVLIVAVLAAFVAYFFRNPEREIPAQANAVVSPADGKVVRVASHEQGTQVSIFLSPLDVHVNRAPIGGVIARQDHRPGKFIVAFDERASAQNEQVVITIRGDRELTFALIAGILARRIVLWKKAGDRVNKGDRIGLIRFGSRVDVFLPPGCEPAIQPGDRVKGGSSLIAHWRV